jgi:hypothetical protein
MSEENCYYVSSHGLIKSCKFAISSFSNPNIPFEVARLKKGELLYLDANLVKKFYESYWQYVKEPIVLVSGNQDINFTDINEYNALLESKNLIAWYSQNMCITHTKCKNIPIGLDYHTLFGHIGMEHPWGRGVLPIVQENYLKQIITLKKPWAERYPAAFCNWHFFADRGDRKEVLEKADKNSLYLVPKYQNRNDTWVLQTQFAFVCSPSGGGLDCHRTWEALCLGCVPIIKTSKMDPLFNDLPVWIVKDWSEVTAEACHYKKTEFSLKQDLFASKNLSLTYWVNLMKTAT